MLKKNTTVGLIIILLCPLLLFASGAKPVDDEKSSLPYSKQATIIDNSSPSEVLLESTGVYYSTYKSKRARKKDITKYGVQEASIDSKKTAIYSLLFMGTDPILSNEEERNAFHEIEEEFFIIENIEDYITYEDKIPQKKITLSNYEGLKIVKKIKVNRDLLIQNLEENKIITSQSELTAAIGNPFIMVIPQTKTLKESIESLQKNPINKHAATVIQNTLTVKQYDVVLPDQQDQLNTITKKQLSIENTKADPSYELALSLGSDVYIDFNIAEADTEYDTKKYSATLRAFETSTGRLLGSETGYSQARRGDDYVSTEEAILQALPNLLSRISNYWKTDMLKGIQYKTIISISKESFKDENIEPIQDGIIDSIEKLSHTSKEIIVTKHTIDYILWVDSETLSSARKVYKKLKAEYRLTNAPGKLELINQNRKLLQIIVK